MASLTCKRSSSKNGLAVVVIRESGTASIPGSISWLSCDEFKMVIDSPLKFHEKVKIVFNFGSLNEQRIPATVGIIKRESKTRLSVHGSFEESLGLGIVEELAKNCIVERRFIGRRDCNLEISVQREGEVASSQVSVTNLSTIGCCFETSELLHVDERIVLEFHDMEEHIMTVPAIICRVEKSGSNYRFGCSFRSNLGLLAEENSSQSSVDWMEKITELVNSLPNI